MRLHLSYPSSGEVEIILPKDRLPSQILEIDGVKCNYKLEKHPDYYLLILSTQCNVSICCQRCMEKFDMRYQNHTQIGLCDDEGVAEQMMDTLEPVVLTSDEIPFETIVIDELYLYLPLFHQDLKQCQYLGS